MPDAIRLTGLQFYAHHGADAAERELGQRFEIDLKLELDLQPAGQTDDLTRTVNYREVYELVKEAMQPPCQLIEAVAERIAERVLFRFEVYAVTVRVRKPSVPLGGLVRYAEVEIRRKKG